jgi:hypothetical protein
MKKLVAIFIISIYVTSFTEVHQLLKLPVLWQHYAEHQAKDNTITFLEYLSHHYQAKDDHDDDHARDMELPFKDCEHYSFIQPVTLSWFVIDLKPNHFISRKTYPCFSNQFTIAFHLTEIWQPPKI